MKYEITAAEYKKLRDEKAPHLLLDVRQNWEVKKASISEAKHIGLPELIDHVDELEKNQKIIVYCHHGVRSMNACFFLRELGFQDVLSLAGGIEAWSTSVDPSIPHY
jgi:rhodanese-related sulfurtransferase